MTRIYNNRLLYCIRTKFKTLLISQLGNDTSIQDQHWATNADITNLHELLHTLGIPINDGLGHTLIVAVQQTEIMY